MIPFLDSISVPSNETCFPGCLADVAGKMQWKHKLNRMCELVSDNPSRNIGVIFSHTNEMVTISHLIRILYLGNSCGCRKSSPLQESRVICSPVAALRHQECIDRRLMIHRNHVAELHVLDGLLSSDTDHARRIENVSSCLQYTTAEEPRIDVFKVMNSLSVFNLNNDIEVGPQSKSPERAQNVAKTWSKNS